MPKIEELWDDVLFTVELFYKQGIIYAMHHALQDFCSYTGYKLGIVDLKFSMNVGSYFMNNTHYVFDVTSVQDARQNAVYVKDRIAIIPLEIITGQRDVGFVEPDVYTNRDDQCRGYNRSLIQNKQSDS